MNYVNLRTQIIHISCVCNFSHIESLYHKICCKTVQSTVGSAYLMKLSIELFS